MFHPFTFCSLETGGLGGFIAFSCARLRHVSTIFVPRRNPLDGLQPFFFLQSTDKCAHSRAPVISCSLVLLPDVFQEIVHMNGSKRSGPVYSSQQSCSGGMWSVWHQARSSLFGKFTGFDRRSGSSEYIEQRPQLAAKMKENLCYR